MILTIHRSAHEIGGNCIELESKGFRVLLDAGYPLDPDLNGKPPEELLPPTLDLEKPIDALLLSHPHLDHYGLWSALPTGTRVWCGRGTQTLMRINAEIFGHPITDDVTPWQHRAPFSLGPLEITPFLTDHSALDAYMLLVASPSHRVLYTGDFRATGRKAALVKAMISNPPADVDVLLMEGTTLGRRDPFPTETDIENRLIREFKDTRGRVFISWSAQNIDRLVSIYRACLQSGRTLVLDTYTSYICSRLNAHTQSIPVPGWKNIKCVVTSDRNKWFRRLDKQDFIENHCVPNGISAKTLRHHPHRWVIFTQAGLQSDFDRHLDLSPDDLWIYSMWQGYLKDPDNKMAQLAEWFRKGGVPGKSIHTSGHASKPDLMRFSRAVNPRHLIPIHSFEWDSHLADFENVLRLGDGHRFQIR